MGGGGTKSTKKPQKATVKEKAEGDAGISDKISKVFYGWMKKKKAKVFVSIRTDQFVIKNLICEGTFGKVYTAVNIQTHLTAAAKVEPINSLYPQLRTEYEIYEKLGCDHTGFIKVYHYGQCLQKRFNVLIMELLGPDLDDLFVTCNGSFSLKTVMLIALQTLQIIRHVHSKNIIYRDIKPENFCIGHKYKNKEKFIYIVDFGLSKIMNAPIPVFDGEEKITDYLIGTARYMSINSHYAIDHSHRDDLESLGYMYVYFLKGRLPWMGLSKSSSTNDHYRSIAKMKASIPPDELVAECHELVLYLKYVRSLQYMETPNYDYLIGLINKAMQMNNFKNDYIFDWTPIMNQRYLNSTLDVDPDS